MYIEPFIYLMTTFGLHCPTAVPSSAPVHLQGSAVNSTAIQLQWEPPPLSDQNGVIRSYIINISVAETGSSFQLTSETTTLYISNLHPFYTYTLTVAAVTIGPGPYGQVFTVQMPEYGMDSCNAHFTFCISYYCNPYDTCVFLTKELLLPCLLSTVNILPCSSKQCTHAPPRQCS